MARGDMGARSTGEYSIDATQIESADASMVDDS